MFTSCPLFVRAHVPDQEKGSEPEKSTRSKLSRGLDPCLPLWSSIIKSMPNRGEHAQFAKSASLGRCFLLCHEITREKETYGIVLASYGAKPQRCEGSHPEAMR